jgi:Tol biopolymer transport system component
VKDLGTGELVRASVSGAGSETAAGAYRPSLSADGRVVAFDSFAADLSPDDRDEDGDVFVKDLATDRLTVTSPGDGEARDASLSSDGRRVAFSSTSTDLDAGDTAPGIDSYVSDLVTGAVFLASSTPFGAAAESPSIAPALSGDASVVAFATPAGDLGPSDTNGLADVYARPVPWPAHDAPQLRLEVRVVGEGLGRRRLLVQVSGSAGAPSGVETVTLEVADEYDRPQALVLPVDGAGALEVAFSRDVQLSTRVRSDDPDGREFTVHAVVTDVQGRQAAEHVHITAPR